MSTLLVVSILFGALDALLFFFTVEGSLGLAGGLGMSVATVLWFYLYLTEGRPFIHPFLRTDKDWKNILRHDIGMKLID